MTEKVFWYWSQFSQTTIYHWPMFPDNATSLTTYKVVSGPFQFGEAVQLDKAQSEVIARLR